MAFLGFDCFPSISNIPLKVGIIFVTSTTKLTSTMKIFKAFNSRFADIGM